MRSHGGSRKAASPDAGMAAASGARASEGMLRCVQARSLLRSLAKLGAEPLDTWQFYQNEAGLWCWKHTASSGISTEGERCFESRTDCIANAMRHGYLSCPSLRPASAAERRFAIPWS
jgi:hypothetical protein